MTGSVKTTRAEAVTIQRLHQAPAELSGHRILDLYDRGIEGCLTRNAQQVREVLLELMGALNFHYEEAALGLFRIYELSFRHAQRRRFDVPLHVLRRLRTAWAV